MDIEKKFEDLGRAFEEFKKTNEQRIAEIAKSGQASALTEEKLAKANEHMDKLQAQIDGLKVAMSRPGMGGGVDPEAEMKAKSALERKAVGEYMRRGEKGMSAEELKALSTDDNANGGYFITQERSGEIVKKLFESSPMRQLADVQTIGGKSLEILQDLDEAGSAWAGETESRSTSSTPTLKMIEIFLHELVAKPKATQAMLDDGGIDVEAWLASKVVEKFGRDEASAFVNGNGIKKPRGFLTYASGTGFGQIEQVVSGSAATITADGLIDLQSALKEGYQGNATWMMKRTTRGAVRKLKGSDNNYLWQPGLVLGAPDLILGRPVVLADDMPALGAGALSVAYGDFKQGYQIIEKLGVRTLRDPFSAKPYVEFYTTKRVGGDVKNFEAIKIGKCST